MHHTCLPTHVGSSKLTLKVYVSTKLLYISSISLNTIPPLIQNTKKYTSLSKKNRDYLTETHFTKWIEKSATIHNSKARFATTTATLSLIAAS